MRRRHTSHRLSRRRRSPLDPRTDDEDDDEYDAGVANEYVVGQGGAEPSPAAGRTIYSTPPRNCGQKILGPPL